MVIICKKGVRGRGWWFVEEVQYPKFAKKPEESLNISQSGTVGIYPHCDVCAVLQDWCKSLNLRTHEQSKSMSSESTLQH